MRTTDHRSQGNDSRTESKDPDALSGRESGGPVRQSPTDSSFIDSFQRSLGNIATLRMITPHQSSDGVIAPVSRRPPLSAVHPMLQRSPAAEATPAPSPSPETAPPAISPVSEETPAEQAAPTPGLIVDDNTTDLAPGQMKKSEFLAQLKSAVCRTAEEALAGTIWSAVGCPWISHWFDYYNGRSSRQIERAIQRYAPGGTGLTSAADYLPLITSRVRSAIAAWALTGEISGVPQGVSTAAPGGAGRPPTEGADVQFKGQASRDPKSPDPQHIRNRLEPGRPLDSGVRSRMESAFGADFSRVRIHTGAGDAQLSSDLDARAFTVGSDVAFGRDEYRPGTLVGDALIAHELAHTIQQAGGRSAAAPLPKGEEHAGSLEAEADIAAVGAVASLWSGMQAGLSNISRNALPRMKSGLRLQRCDTSEQYKSGRGGEYHGVGGILHAYVYEPLQEDYSNWMTWGENLPGEWGDEVPVLGHVGGAVVGCIPWALGGVMKIVVGVPQLLTPKTQEEHFLTVATAGTGTPAVRIGGGIKYGLWWLKNFFKKNPKAEKKILELGKEGVEQALEKAGNKAPKTIQTVAANQAKPGALPNIIGATKQVAQNLVKKGYTPEAINAMRQAGIKVTNRQLSSAGPSTIKFINTFYKSSGFDQVMNAWSAGGKTQEGARFIMKYCAEKLSGKTLIFEYPAGIKKTVSGETWARYVDVVIKGGNKVHPGDTLYLEFKSWTSATLSKSTGKIKKQLVRDRALFESNTIRWVFDSSKVSKSEVLDAFLGIIKKDAYLKQAWGGTEKEIRESLSLLIELF